ncbi:hypothetical protein CCAX7_22320 [Capsulimonas corticalis]|uniref:Zinc-finger domain-containing protein n=1 Tax=Capsulimonas corticalis TaxID=2219043 RepID=A0A402D270_9BACT|nr:DUF4349 domain-containing protein [Capsulimonas corticalis]BDI30181.1 hypothetical protein CCAX7_22320 [Capsulimonas corticalis]
MTQRHAYEDDLKAYIDGELSLLRRLAVARHLAHCASCRMEVAQMSQITEELRPETDEALDPNLRAKILADLGPASTSPVRTRRKLRPMPVFAGSVAAIAVLWCLAPIFTANHLGSPMAAKHIGLGLTQYAQDYDERSVATVPAQSMTPPGAYYNSANRTFAPTQTFDSNGKNGVTLQIKNPESRFMDDSGRIDAKQSPPVTYSVKLSDKEAGVDSTRLVHNEASIGVEVANSEASSADLATLVKGVGGYEAENSLTTDENGIRSADVTVKVPVDQFDNVMTQIGKFGKVTSKSITGEDITEKTSDADQAEQVMEDEVRRTDAELKSRGKRVTWRDQEQARDLRIQLNQSRARLELLKKMARLSSIEVTLNEKAKDPPKVTSNFWTNLWASTGAATDTLAAAFGRVLALVIWFVAYAPLWIPAILGYRWWAKKNKREESTV